MALFRELIRGNMNLLENAKRSIDLALDDFKSKSKNRLLSSVRNLHAGILLLYKERLRALSPSDSEEVLLKQRIIPKKNEYGHVHFVGEGKKTVDVQQIRKRFAGLGIPTDWKRFERINDLRNDIEHYYTKLDRDSIRGMISDTFILIRDFVQNELKRDPMEILGSASWKTLISVSEVYEREKEECIKRLDAINWGSASLAEALYDLQCQQCGSRLLMPTSKSKDISECQMKCRSCGTSESFEQFAERALIENVDNDF
jgi:hypothetical protein